MKEIAARHKLKMALGEDLSDKPVEHIDQTNESDGSFLMRLARQYGAIASVKNGNLLFIRQGRGKSASGKPLPVITITRKDGDSHRFTLADRGAYTGVIASWLHTREWTITTLTHTVSPDNGFTTSLELEVRIDDFEME